MLENSIEYNDGAIEAEYTLAGWINADKTYLDVSSNGRNFVAADSVEYDQANSTAQETFTMRIEEDEVEDLL
jgi:hypothetical protein